LNMLTESILERQAGIILFCLFYAIFSSEYVAAALKTVPEQNNT